MNATQLAAMRYLVHVEELLKSISTGNSTPEETRDCILELDRVSDRFATEMKIPRSRKNGNGKPTQTHLFRNKVEKSAEVDIVLSPAA